MCRISAVARASCRYGNTHVRIARQTRTAPTGKGVARFRRIALSDVAALHGICIRIAVRRTSA